MKKLGVFLLSPGWDASPSQGYPHSIKFAGIHLYTWLERDAVRVKCLAQEHNTMSPARARTRTAQSGDERTNHEATVPPAMMRYKSIVKVTSPSKTQDQNDKSPYRLKTNLLTTDNYIKSPYPSFDACYEKFPVYQDITA